MYACACETRCEFTQWCAGRRISHLLFATHPRRPTLYTGIKFAPLSAPITHRKL
jgi:hypothetical protein